jgi:hypothetical protein
LREFLTRPPREKDEKDGLRGQIEFVAPTREPVLVGEPEVPPRLAWMLIGEPTAVFLK